MFISRNLYKSLKCNKINLSFLNQLNFIPKIIGKKPNNFIDLSVDKKDKKPFFKIKFLKPNFSGNNNNQSNNPFNNKSNNIIFYFFGITAVLFYFYSKINYNLISFQEFAKKYILENRVSLIVISNDHTGKALLKESSTDFRRVIPFSIGSIKSFEKKIEEIQKENGIKKEDYIQIKYNNSEPINIINLAFSSILIFYILSMMFRPSGFSMGKILAKSKFRTFFDLGNFNADAVNRSSVKTKFKDVAGLKNAKIEITEFVDFLRNKEKYTKIGAKIPKGALLVGPPGTGKTLLARALAGESFCPFFYISGSDFIEMFVGVGPSRIRSLFKKARKNAPCIIFIDEIDAVAKKRRLAIFGGGCSERESTLNQLLVEMDGFKSSEGIVVLAGTNREDVLDPALLRPGRFDRKILIDLPDIKEREEIFRVHLKPLKLAMKPQDISMKMAALCPGFSGADIANVCNEAAIFAGRKNKKIIEFEDFSDAQERVIAGLKTNSNPLSKIERKHVAYHEAGHAIVGWFTKYADPLLKVTVVPRSGGVMGFAQYLPSEVKMFNMNELFDKICMALGGRVSEEIFFQHLTTGAVNDLEKVTQIAYSKVKIFGMSDNVGMVSFPPKPFSIYNQRKIYSEKLAKSIDEEAKKIVKRAYEKTKSLLLSKKDEIVKLAEELLKRETLSHDDLVDLFGPKQYQSLKYKEYLMHNNRKVRNINEGENSNGKCVEGKSDE